MAYIYPKIRSKDIKGKSGTVLTLINADNCYDAVQVTALPAISWIYHQGRDTTRRTSQEGMHVLLHSVRTSAGPTDSQPSSHTMGKSKMN
jgi:hypothetical protein